MTWMRAYDTDAHASRAKGVESAMFNTGGVDVFLGLDIGTPPTTATD